MKALILLMMLATKVIMIIITIMMMARWTTIKMMTIIPKIITMIVTYSSGLKSILHDDWLELAMLSQLCS